jgi:acyl-coenzyme A synthetase/AMP-(fatty) acid ligase
MKISPLGMNAKLHAASLAPTSCGEVLSRLTSDPIRNRSARIRAVVSNDPANVLFHTLAAWQAGQIVALVGDETAVRDYLGGEDYVVADDPETGAQNLPEDGICLRFPKPPDAAAALVLSSGTTGRPKGILLSRAGVMHSRQVLLDVFGMSSGEVYGNLSRLHTIGGLRAICLALLDGIDIRFFDDEPRTGVAFAEAVLSSGVAVALCGASFVRLLARSAPWLAGRPTSLRALMSCGSLYDDAASAAVRDAYGIEVVNAYGQTETSGIVMCEPVGSYRPGRMAPCLPGVTQSFRSAGDGLWELGITAPHPFTGYLGRAEHGAGPIWTGDLVRRESDDLVFAGRIGHAMKSRSGAGWLLPEVVEGWVRAQFPGVDALARPDDRHETLNVLVASETLPAGLLDRMVADLGPDYAAVRFQRARIERTAAGKVAQAEPLE